MNNLRSTITNITSQIVARIESEEKGQSMVEMAIVLSLLLVMTFGIIDISRCIYTNSVVTAAAQEGVRAGIIDANEISATIASKMIGLDMSHAVVNVTNAGDIIEVEIAYSFEFITPLASSLLASLQLTGNASMVVM